MAERKPVQSPFTRRALSGTLPGKVHADLRTDVRTTATRETWADILRRTMPVAKPEVR